jgi:hypothetical protein
MFSETALKYTATPLFAMNSMYNFGAPPHAGRGRCGRSGRERRQVGPEVGPTSASFVAVFPQERIGPDCIFWADLTPLSLNLLVLPLDDNCIGCSLWRAQRTWAAAGGGAVERGALRPGRSAKVTDLAQNLQVDPIV